jgi:hypothetical protein
MNTDNIPKTDNISEETSAKLLRLHIEDASRPTRQSTGKPDYNRGDDGTVRSLLIALLIFAATAVIIWVTK